MEIVEMPCRQSMLRTLLLSWSLLPRTLLARVLFVPAFLLAAVAAAGQASAQSQITSSETFKTMIGKWEISSADRDRSCLLTFKADPSGALFKLDADKA